MIDWRLRMIMTNAIAAASRARFYGNRLRDASRGWWRDGSPNADRVH
jgi:hypothetical protein